MNYLIERRFNLIDSTGLTMFGILIAQGKWLMAILVFLIGAATSVALQHRYETRK